MADCGPSKLQLWEGGIPPHLGDQRRPTAPAAAVARLVAAEVFGAVNRIRSGAELYSLQWFLNVESARHSRHGRWIPHLLEFQKHAGETLLGLGEGLGTDWVQYARHGAEVVVCSGSAEQLSLVQRNFSLRSLPVRLLNTRPLVLPLEAASVDVVCLTGLPGAEDELTPQVEEIYRVLKPGGKVLAVVPAHYDVDFWCRSWLPWRRRVAPASLAFTARSLRRLLGRFVEHHVYKRQLRRAEVPHLWRWLPLPLLERLLGRVLVVKAFKPLSAARPLQVAA